jgi:hypothetical protein
MNTHDFTTALNQPNSTFANDVMLVLQRQFNHSVRRVDGSIAAGQAVASAVYQLLDLGDAPFRDLDIFWMNVENTPKKTIYPDYQKLEWFANNADEKTLYLKPNRHKAIESIAKQKLTYSSSFACYGLGVMSVGSYFIKDTFMDSTNKRLNHVLTSLNHESTLAGRISNASATIRNFDINCCQVALELETMTLVASDAFVEFLTTKALKVVNYNTTMHSAVRLDKKSKDIAFASVDMDSELASLQTLRQLVVEVENSRKQNGDRYWPLYGNAFSDVYFERYKASSDVIQRAFSIDAETFDFGNFYEKQTDDGSYAGGIHRPEKKTLFFLTPTHYDADFIDAAKTLIPILPHMTDANPLMLFIPVIEAIQAQPALRDTLKWINDGIDLHSHYEVVSKEIVALHLRDDLDAPVELMIASITSIIDFSKELNRYPRGVNTDLFFNLLHHAKNFKELGNVETLYNAIVDLPDSDIDFFLATFSRLPNPLSLTYAELKNAIDIKNADFVNAFHAKFPSRPNHISKTLASMLNVPLFAFNEDEDNAPFATHIEEIQTSEQLYQFDPEMLYRQNWLDDCVIACFKVTFSNGVESGAFIHLNDIETPNGMRTLINPTPFNCSEGGEVSLVMILLHKVKCAVVKRISNLRHNNEPLKTDDDFGFYLKHLSPLYNSIEPDLSFDDDIPF